jgi:hypothetical protein
MKSLTHPFLQGWLEKRKHKKSGILSSTTKRWFTIENIGPYQEIALCYYQNPSSPSISGWIFLSDVTNFDERNEDGRTWIVIEHPSRTFWLGSLDTHQHHLWINNLSHYCRKTSNLQEKGSKPCVEIAKEIIEVKKLEPADARGEFGSSSNHRQSFQTTSDRDFSSELEFIRSITGIKSDFRGDRGETISNSSPSIQHDYDLGYHLRTDKVTSLYDELINDIDGKASIEDSNVKLPQTVHENKPAAIIGTLHSDQNTHRSENSVRVQRDYANSDETINSRLSRAILTDQSHDLTHNNDEISVQELNIKDQYNVDSSENAEDKRSHMGSVSDSPLKEVTREDYSCREDPTENSSESSSIMNGKTNIPFDDDCSFLPDNDFLTADWDEDSDF